MKNYQTLIGLIVIAVAIIISAIIVRSALIFVGYCIN